MRKWLFVIAVILGLSIAYVDSRPTWDDTGITAFAILLSCGILGLINPRRPWIWALAVGAWIPLVSIFITHNYGGILALLFAFAGAYGGMAFRRILDWMRQSNK
jgi:hypothetical protein